MSHEIFLKYFIEYFFFCSTHGFDIELYDILYCILCKLYILRIGVLDWHIHCARVWYEIIKNVEHSLDFHLGSCKGFDEVENVSDNFPLTDTGLCSEILKYALFIFLALVWWYTLRNKLQWNFNRKYYISIKEKHLKMAAAKWWPFCLGLNILIDNYVSQPKMNTSAWLHDYMMVFLFVEACRCHMGYESKLTVCIMEYWVYNMAYDGIAH